MEMEMTTAEEREMDVWMDGTMTMAMMAGNRRL
jgi:hypothetical protein